MKDYSVPNDDVNFSCPHGKPFAGEQPLDVQKYETGYFLPLDDELRYIKPQSKRDIEQRALEIRRRAAETRRGCGCRKKLDANSERS